MHVLINSNIIISTSMNRFSTPARAVRKVISDHILYISEQTVKELGDFLKKKIAQKYPESREYFEGIVALSIVIPTPIKDNPLFWDL